MNRIIKNSRNRVRQDRNEDSIPRSGDGRLSSSAVFVFFGLNFAHSIYPEVSKNGNVRP